MDRTDRVAVPKMSVLRPCFGKTDSQLFPIYNELKNKTQGRMNIVIGTSIGLAAVSYEVVSCPWPSVASADHLARYRECAHSLTVL